MVPRWKDARCKAGVSGRTIVPVLAIYSGNRGAQPMNQEPSDSRDPAEATQSADAEQGAFKGCLALLGSVLLGGLVFAALVYGTCLLAMR